MKKLQLTLLASIASLSLSAQDINKAKLDSLFDRLAEKDKAIMSVAIAKNGKVIYTKATGFSDIDGNKKIPVSVNSKYRTGSITKVFTGVILFQLIDEGKLSLDDKLDHYLPTIPNASKITIGQMLTHKSGIHSITSDSEYMNYYTSGKTKEQLLDLISKTTPDFEPGSNTSYSNSAFILLGMIAEKITGKTYPVLVKERIVSKLGLTDTYVGSKINTKNNEVQSFSFKNGWKKEPETDMSIPFSAGSVVSTPSDLVKFIDGLFTGKLISAKSLEQMKTLDGRYAHAMMRFPFNDKQIFGHTGGIDGFNTIVGYLPSDSLSFAWTSNGMNTDNNMPNLGILNIYYKIPYKIPEYNSYKHTDAELDQFLGKYKAKDAPLVMEVKKENGNLIIHPEGQSAEVVTGIAKNSFEFERAGAVFVFNPEKKEVTLKQRGAELVFTKE